MCVFGGISLNISHYNIADYINTVIFNEAVISVVRAYSAFGG
jgi:hypothetical protein